LRKYFSGEAIKNPATEFGEKIVDDVKSIIRSIGHKK
jgi:exopolysaccharide biosynthesis protein